ncbi:zinc finger protein [Saccharomonospora sp. NB11]|jgi:hypothetical protein|uniref:zinc finger protein n=1 Tax=Saccharomonospora sp. NB11 TaxID=1642298 RepID=UPI0018D1E751|nr:zinc finger protein [Saccharomonospora sp. NB11]
MQPYLWQQAEKFRHVYDTAAWYPIRIDSPFETLCGRTVTATARDMVTGLWFDPTCFECELKLATLAGWSSECLERLRHVQRGRKDGDPTVER